MTWWIWLLIGAVIGGIIGFMACALLSINRHDDQVDFLTETYNELAADYNTLIDSYSRSINENTEKKTEVPDVNK